MRAVCTDSGWNSNPADLICTEGMLGDCQHPLFGSKPHNYQTRVGGWLVLIMCVMSKVDMKYRHNLIVCGYAYVLQS